MDRFSIPRNRVFSATAIQEIGGDSLQQVIRLWNILSPGGDQLRRSHRLRKYPLVQAAK